MPRTVSIGMREALQAQETSEVPVVLITITHPDLTTPLRLSSDPTQRIQDSPPLYATVSRGKTHVYLPMSVILPDDKDDSAPAARIIIDNVDREMIALLRSTQTQANVDFDVVLASTPDIIEINLPTMQLVAADYDRSTITLTLQIEALATEPFPSGTFSPADFPGLF